LAALERRRAYSTTDREADAEPGCRSLTSPNDVPVVAAGDRRSALEVLALAGSMSVLAIADYSANV
jgi:hypothetical protein